ncbi:MAG: hypothetical protein QM692_17970, partial [Thermomicrobiales bacterium]
SIDVSPLQALMLVSDPASASHFQLVTASSPGVSALLFQQTIDVCAQRLGWDASKLPNTDRWNFASCQQFVKPRLA